MISGIRSYDELNEFVGKSRSEPYDTYFGGMDLSEEEIKKRITLAEKLEENFLFVMAFFVYNGAIQFCKLRTYKE